MLTTEQQNYKLDRYISSSLLLLILFTIIGIGLKGLYEFVVMLFCGFVGCS